MRDRESSAYGDKEPRDAGLGIPYARYVLAHEIGHIVLHDEFAVAFSDDKAAQLKYVQDEESGE
jgi:hypothetical protein